MTIKVPETFQSLTNRVGLKLLRINLATAGGTKLFKVSAYLNATLTSPTWVNYSATASHMAQIDMDASGFSGGLPAGAFAGTGGFESVIDLDTQDIVLFRGDTITLTGQQLSAGGSTNVFALLTWAELF